jgi:cellulose synthase/poly-beta-1,6-N-acetylglucosamine synthase-like glycosyltransferase
VTIVATIAVVFMFVSAALIGWTFMGFPVFMSLLARIKPKPHRQDATFLPRVTLMIMTYNEEKTIARKLENSLALNYPQDKLEIFVVDSASTDDTRQIAEEFAKKSSQVSLIAQEERKGKASAINFGIKRASGEIVVLTDGNAMMEREAIALMVRHFADSAVGGVCGRFEARNLQETSIGGGGQAYWEIERFLREKESSIDSCIHMSGEITALRQTYYVDVEEPNLAEDLDMAIDLRKRGYRIIYEPDAVVFEPAATSVRDLTAQKKRVVIGTWHALMKYRTVLFNPKYGWYGAVILPSHKLLQALAPFMFLVLTVSTVVAYLLSRNVVILCFLILLAACYSLVVLSFATAKITAFKDFKPFVLMKYFATVNFICAMGFVDFARGRRMVEWKKIESSREF